MSDPKPHLLDTETWDDRELLEVICSRYFLLGGQGISELSWEVNGRDGRDPSECLVSLNRHLMSLSLIAVLDEGDPPVMSIGSLPIQPVVMPSWQQSLVWVLAASFTTLSGSLWISSMEPGLQSFDPSILETAIVFFTLPLIGSLLLASYARIFAAKAFDVENSHLIPLAFPVFSPEWPFSLVSAIGQTRPDLHPVPNRRALGLIELTAPAVMFVCGTLLTIIGLGMTSVQPPAYETSPVAVDLNLISEVLASILVEPHASLRLQWMHPTGLAGIALSIVSWALLLPIPGFPGDRILHSLLGPKDMQDDRIQTSIFITTLGFAILIFISTEYWPWMLLAAIAAWRRFSPEQLPEPFVVDEYADLDEIPMRQIATMTIAILLLGYPGLQPSFEIEEWDEGLSTESWPEYIAFEGGQVEVDLLLEPAGVVPVSGWLQMRIEGPLQQQYQIDSDCFGHSPNQTLYPNFIVGGPSNPSTSSVCRFDNISHSSTGSVSIDMDLNGDWESWRTFSLIILVDLENHVTQHTIVFQPTDVTSTVDPMWVMVEDTETPRICTELSVVEGDHVNLSLYPHWQAGYWLPSLIAQAPNPFWYFENETSLGPGTHDLCIRGHEGALSRSYLSLMLGPEINMSRSNSSNSLIVMPIEGESPTMQVSGREWKLLESLWPISPFSNEPFSLSYVESGPLFCPSTDVIPEINATGDWVRELADRASILIDPTSDTAGNGTIRIGDQGWLLVCNGIHIVTQWEVVEGPEVLFNGLPTGTYFHMTYWLTIENRENYSMPLSIELSGDADIWSSIPSWNISVVGPMKTLQIEAPSINGCCIEQWATVDEDGITIHFAARSDGAVA